MRRFLVLVLLLGTALPVFAQRAPSGWRKFDHARTGLRWFHPKEFRVTPTQPTEKLILAKFQRPKPYSPRKGSQRKPESFIVFRLEPKPQQDETETNATKEKPKSYEEVVERQNAIYDWKRLMRARGEFRGLSWTTLGGDFESAGGKEFKLERRDKYVGFMTIRTVDDGETYGVVGFCDDVVEKRFRKYFQQVCKLMHRPEGYSAVTQVDADYYKGKKYRGVEFRVKARRAMVKGWKALDTDNFFVVYSTKNVKLVNKIVNDLEAVRPHFAKQFPPVGEVDAVSVVRVCKDLKEYQKYGGPPGSAGYWNFVAQELVLYDAKGAGRSIADSFVVLYHEAFHQYIFYALGELSPDYWFNEGMADYFAGAEFYRHSKRLKEIGLNRWRMPGVKRLVDKPAFVALKPLIDAKRPQFYGPKMGLMYAEAWSYCYFLLRSKLTDEKPEWRAIIPKYYDALKDAKGRLDKLLTKDATLDEKRKMQDRMREEAMKKAYEGIDLEALEREWKDWIRNTKGPRKR